MMLLGNIVIAVLLLLSCDSALSRTETVNKAAANALYTLAESCSLYNCPSQWPNRVAGQDSCYLYSPVKATWAQAKKECEADGGHLVQFDSEAEMAIVRGLLASHYNIESQNIPWLWTGLNDQVVEGEYRWAGFDGQLGAESTMWDADQPDDDHRLTNMWSGEDCTLFNGFHLNDEVCGDQYTYMCEYKPSTTNPASP